MHFIKIFFLISASISLTSAVPASKLPPPPNRITTAGPTPTVPAFVARALSTALYSLSIYAPSTGNDPARQVSASVAYPSSPAAEKQLLPRGKPTTQSIDTPYFHFHVQHGPPSTGFRIVSTCYEMLNDATTHDPTHIVGNAYSTREHAAFPAMYIDMLSDDYPLRWADVMGLANGLIALVTEINGGVVPTRKGRGWEYRGDLFPRGSPEGHPEEGLVVGHFYMGRFWGVDGVGRNGSAVS